MDFPLMRVICDKMSIEDLKKLAAFLDIYIASREANFNATEVPNILPI